MYYFSLYCYVMLLHLLPLCYLFIFFFNDTATTEIYTLSLHDALPISDRSPGAERPERGAGDPEARGARQEGVDDAARGLDRKSTRLNSSHTVISYAVFCLKKKKKKKIQSYNVNLI